MGMSLKWPKRKKNGNLMHNHNTAAQNTRPSHFKRFQEQLYIKFRGTFNILFK